MTLATKNGSLIVKDGQIAEDCGCCGGWYCYCENDCNTTPACSYCLGSCPPYRAPESFTATVTASDYVNRVMGRVYYNIVGGSGAGVGLTSYFKGSALSGTHTLARVSATRYETSLPDNPACSSSGVAASNISFDLASCYFAASVRGQFESSLANYPSDTVPRAGADLGCSTQTCPSPYSCATANPTWVLRDFTHFPFSKFVSCSEISSSSPVVLTLALPDKWWVEGSYVGFGFTSRPGFTGPYGYVSDPVVYEQSGSRDVTVSIVPNY